MEDQARIIREGKSGIADPDEEAGDAVFVLDAVAHDHFRRDGNDLVYQKDLSAAEAVSGCDFAITHLDGREITVSFRSLATRLGHVPQFRLLSHLR